MIKKLEDQLPIKVNEHIDVHYIKPAFIEDLFEIYANENISKYVARKPHMSIEDTGKFIVTINNRMKAGKNLYLGVYHSDCDKLIGIIRFLIKDEPGELTVGYALNQAYWGKGIIPVVLSKLADIIGSCGEFCMLRATVRPENIKSQRCLEKCGFQLAGSFVKNDEVADEKDDGKRLLFIKKL